MLFFFFCDGGFEIFWVFVVLMYVLFCKYFRDVSCFIFFVGEVFGIDIGYVEFVFFEFGYDWLLEDVV